MERERVNKIKRKTEGKKGRVEWIYEMKIY